MIKVSIIIPVYNAEAYLERCLESVVNQTLKEIEIIIVNDGSTDNSLSICKRFAKEDSRIRILNQKNCGNGNARNQGIKTAQGEYIGFIDSDDWIDLDFYEKLYNTAQKYNSDIAFTDFIRKGKNKHKIRINLKEEKCYTSLRDKIDACKSLTLGCVWNKIYRKELILNNKIEFPEGKFYEDGIFAMQAIYYANSIISTPNTYYYYFVNPNSIVKSKLTQQKIDDRIISRINIVKFLNQQGFNLNPEEFLVVAFKLRLWFLTLLVIKEDFFVKNFYLFGSIPIAKLKKNSGNRTFITILGIKFTFRKKNLSYKKIKELNKKYENGKGIVPIVKNFDETVEELIKSEKSIARFGDGEFDIIFGEELIFQNHDAKLQEKLSKILISSNPNICIGIPNIFENLGNKTKNDEKFWRKYIFYNREKIYSILNMEKTYYDSFISRVYIGFKATKKEYELKFNKLKTIWRNKNVVFVEGEGTRLGYNNDLFSNTRSIKRIICPAKNAFSKYDEILNACRSLPKDVLFILALGPTATVLAYELAEIGYRALDMGHIDIEYEWFIRSAIKRIPIKDKYVNENKRGRVITQINDKKYLNEIYKEIK